MKLSKSASKLIFSNVKITGKKDYYSEKILKPKTHLVSRSTSITLLCQEENR